MIKKILSILFLVLFILTVFLFFLNKNYFPLTEYNSTPIDTIYIDLNKDKINTNLFLKSKRIENQIISTTIPNISFLYKLNSLLNHKLNKIPIIDKLKDFYFFDNSQMIKNDKFGGIILYDYNLPQIKKYGGIKKFVNIIRKKNTFSILFVDTIQKKHFTGKIMPFIFSDMDYPLTNRKPEYIRLNGLFLSEKMKVEEMINKYDESGLNSFLSPNVDYNYIDSNFKINFDYLVSKSKNQIICLKHFCYDNENGNTHKENSINYNSLNVLKKIDLKPYYYAENKLNRRYLIMVGHHLLKALDSINIASKSSEINKFIKMEFPKAVTISDEVTMQASSNKKIFFSDFDFIEDIQCDIILSHGGNIRNYRKMLIKNIVQIKRKNEKISNILKLKEDYNLIEISKIENY